MQSAGHFCLPQCHTCMPAVSANCNIALFEFNGVCMQSADELKLLKLERKGTLWVAYGVLYTDTWQYCLSETLDVIYTLYIQGVPGGMDKTSGECSLC